MSITKKPLKSKPVSKVTFKVEKDLIGDAETVNLVGDFNNWDSAETPMKGAKNGSFTVALDLENGKTYNFRYLVNGTSWVNDPEADGSAPSPYPDATNSLINL